MENIRIITDSASDIAQNTHDIISVLPMTIRFGEKEYSDGVDLTTKQFYQMLENSKDLPATSLVSPLAFEQEFKAIAENGEKAIVITMSSNLSGTYQSAQIAAEQYPDNIFVVDSKSVAIGEQILVYRAMELISDAKPFREICSILEHEKERICVFALLDTLEYLKRGGRISSTVAFVGGALGIKPIIALVDGKVEMIGKARGTRNGNTVLINEIKSTAGIDFKRPIRLGYAGLDDSLLQSFIQDSGELWEKQVEGVGVSPIGATIGTHVGPGTVAVAFFEEK